MPTLSLRHAAIEAGTSKSTILRAIQAGRLSATRNAEGTYTIDPAELFRVYPPKSEADRLADRTVRQSASDDTDRRILLAKMEAELGALKQLLEAERQRTAEAMRRTDEIREERDAWRAQARQIQAPPPEAPRSASVPTVIVNRRGWWPWRRAG